MFFGAAFLLLILMVTFSFAQSNLEEVQREMQKARKLYNGGSYESALNAFQYIADSFPDTPQEAEAQKYVGMCYLKLKDYDSAIEALGTAIETNPRDAETHYFRGQAFYEEDEYEQSIAALKKAVEIDPKKIPYHEYLAVVYDEAGQFIEAQKEQQTIDDLKIEEELDQERSTDKKNRSKAKKGDLLKFGMNIIIFLGLAILVAA
jgi:tetratricopeptide (TPR) repeat protein